MGWPATSARYLAGDPVEAGPPSATYKLRKLARKHRAALVTAGAFAGLLLLAAAISSYLAIQASRAEIRHVRRLPRPSRPATSEARRATRPKNSEPGGRCRSRRSRGSQGQEVRESESQRLCWSFSRPRYSRQRGPRIRKGAWVSGDTIRDAVDAAVPVIEKSFAGKPAVEASIRDTMGQSYLYLGDPVVAIRHHESALRITAAGLLALTTPTR